MDPETLNSLVLAVRAGGTDCVLELWTQYERFLRMKARQFFATHSERCAAAGVELADLVQESFFSLLDAVEVYDPKSGFSFLTYTNFPLKNRFAAATRMLTPAQRKEPLSRAMSLDKPLPNAEDLTLADVTEDHSVAETKWHSL